MAGSFLSRTWIATALLVLPGCDQPPIPRPEGLPLAPGEQREAAPAWRLREGLVASTVVESGEPLTRNISDDAPHLPGRIENISFSGDAAHGSLWIDHGQSGTSIHVERDVDQQWALVLSSANATYADDTAPDAETEGHEGATMVNDGDGALWFATGGELFYLDAASEGAAPQRFAAAPGDEVIVSMAWNADESSLFLGLQEGTGRASVVAISGR